MGASTLPRDRVPESQRRGPSRFGFVHLGHHPAVNQRPLHVQQKEGCVDTTETAQPQIRGSLRVAQARGSSVPRSGPSLVRGFGPASGCGVASGLLLLTGRGAGDAEGVRPEPSAQNPPPR